MFLALSELPKRPPGRSRVLTAAGKMVWVTHGVCCTYLSGAPGTGRRVTDLRHSGEAAWRKFCPSSCCLPDSRVTFGGQEHPTGGMDGPVEKNNASLKYRPGFYGIPINRLWIRT